MLNPVSVLNQIIPRQQVFRIIIIDTLKRTVFMVFSLNIIHYLSS